MTVGLDIDGAAAPPRANGELVFAAPWESRAFGMAAALADRGAFTWDEFREHLIAAIAASPDDDYYRSWLVALEAIVAERGLVVGADLDARVGELLARPAGHDHRH